MTMTDCVIGGSRFENVKSNAYWSRVMLDSTLSPKDVYIDSYLDHLRDCIKNPTVGYIANDKYINKKPKNYPMYFWRNHAMLGENTKVNMLREILASKVKKLYSKTAKLREYIISDGRLNLDYVTKSKGYNFLDKLKILLTI